MPELEDLERRIAKLESAKLDYSYDYDTRKVLFNTMDRKLVEFLHPQDTNDANDGTFIAINNTPAIQFADAATKVAYFSFIPPENLFISRMLFYWSTPATANNMRWQIDIGEGGSSQQTNARTTGGNAVSTAADGTANDIKITDILNAVPSANPSVDITRLRRGTLWGIKFTRLGADANDTLSNTVNLYGIMVEYRLYAF